MLWVHIPYTKHQNELTSIQENIIIRIMVILMNIKIRRQIIL